MKNNRLKCAAWAVLCLLLPSCLPSKQPLSDATQAEVDERLLGTWTHEDKTYYHVGKLLRSGAPKGFVQIIGADFGKDGELSLIDAVGFSTTLGDDHYLNIVAGSGSQFETSKMDLTQWQIFKYRIDGDQLDVWTANLDFIKQEIKDGKIQGAENLIPMISEASPNLVKWVKANSPRIFREKASLKRATLK